MVLTPRLITDMPAGGFALRILGAGCALLSHFPFWVICHCAHARTIPLQIGGRYTVTALGETAQEHGAVHAEAARGLLLKVGGWWLAFSVFQLAKPVALILQYACLKACGDAAVDAGGRQAGFIVASGFLRGRKPGCRVWHVGAPHQREPQRRGGYWFQHFNNLLSFSNLPLGGGFVMRNVSAMGVAPCT